ncbi:hypothetical protein ACFQ1I_45415 [Kitasatospora arboriphila]
MGRRPGVGGEPLDTLLRTATPVELMRIEADYRRRRGTLSSTGILMGSEVPGGGQTDPHALAVAALMSFDRSGYLRQTGVELLGASADLFALPFLLLRLNDPVEPVRDLAQRAVTARLTGAEHVGILVRLLPLLDGIRRRSRARPMLAGVEDLLRRSGAEELRQGARSGDPVARACCLRWLARIDPTGAVEVAFATKDPGLWQWAARLVTSSKLAPAEQDAVLPLLDSCASPRIRLRALRVRARRRTVRDACVRPCSIRTPGSGTTPVPSCTRAGTPTWPRRCTATPSRPGTCRTPPPSERWEGWPTSEAPTTCHAYWTSPPTRGHGCVPKHGAP